MRSTVEMAPREGHDDPQHPRTEGDDRERDEREPRRDAQRSTGVDAPSTRGWRRGQATKCHIEIAARRGRECLFHTFLELVE